MKKILFSATLFAVCFFAASRANAQATYEYSAIWYDDSDNTINGYSATEVDYYVAVDYQAYVEGYLYDDTSAQLVDSGSAQDSSIAEVYTSASVNSGDDYHVDSYHDVIASYYYEDIEKSPEGCWPCDGCNTDCYYFTDNWWWYDPLGFSNTNPGYYGPWWELDGEGPFEEVEYQDEEYLGETSAGISTKLIPEHLKIGLDQSGSTTCSGVYRQITYVVHDHNHHTVPSILMIEDPPTVTDACTNEPVGRTYPCKPVVTAAGTFTDYLFASCTNGACGFDIAHNKWQWCKTATNHITLGDLNYSIHHVVKVNGHEDDLTGTDLVP
jgi:hypothetical protein